MALADFQTLIDSAEAVATAHPDAGEVITALNDTEIVSSVWPDLSLWSRQVSVEGRAPRVHDTKRSGTVHLLNTADFLLVWAAMRKADVG